MKNKKVLFILGMHRSGTSAITRLVNLMGAGLPNNLMQANADNENGYWESKDIAKLNNQLLKLAQTSWSGCHGIPTKWMSSSDVNKLKIAAIDLIESLFSDLHNECLVIKDPRICRLLPLWHGILDGMNIAYDHVFIFRNPEEVFLSFKKRFDSPEFRPAAIIHREKLNLLWLRYVLDAEYFSRGKNRYFIDYRDLINDSEKIINNMAKYLSEFCSDLKNADSVYQFVSKSHQHHKLKADQPPIKLKLSFMVYELMLNSRGQSKTLNTQQLDQIRKAMDHTIQSYDSLLSYSPKTMHELQPWFSEISQLIMQQLKRVELTKKQVMFLSGAPRSKGHTYRVEHHANALNKAGINIIYHALNDDFDLNEMEHLAAVVVFRAPWNDRLRSLYEYCEEHKIIKIFDVDDLVFKPELMTLENWDYLRLLNENEKQHWHNQFVKLSMTFVKSDHITVPTDTLASESRLINKPTSVLINSLSQKMVNISQSIIGSDTLKPSQKDGFLRLGYASGTPTHQKDFAEVSSVLGQLMSEHSNLKLVVVGHLILSEFPELAQFKNRIELRPIVEHMDLFFEYYQFDINLAPLQLNNIFCESKSQLKYLDAALVEVPTVASATEPFRNSIHQGLTGYCAQNNDEWYKQLNHLISNQTIRKEIGQCARKHAIARFGAKLNEEIIIAEFTHIIEKYHNKQTVKS